MIVLAIIGALILPLGAQPTGPFIFPQPAPLNSGTANGPTGSSQSFKANSPVEFARNITHNAGTTVTPNGTWAGTSVPAGEPTISDAILYVSPNGSDSNDGRSSGSAKATILAAYDALPSSGGIIYIADNSNVGGSVTNQGIWLAGSNDPNFNSLRSGWRKAKPVRFVGVGGKTVLNNSSVVPQSVINGGSSTDTTKPTIWVTGTAFGNITFENLAIRYPAVGIRLGYNSSGGTTSGPTVMVAFINVSVNLNNVIGNGPAVDINGLDARNNANVFWIWFDHIGINGNNAVAVTSMQRRAMYVQGAYLIFVRDTLFTYGGLTYNTPPVQSWSLYVDKVQIEGDFVNPVSPAVEIIGSQNAGTAWINGVETYDAPNTTANVSVDPRLASNVVVVSNIGPAGIEAVTGPATFLGGGRVKTYPLSVRGQVGFDSGRVFGQFDAGRRLFGPVAVRGTNYAQYNPATWRGRSNGNYPTGGNAAITTGVTAPDGTTGATTLTYTSTGNAGVAEPADVNLSLSLGDFLIFGAWMRNNIGGTGGTNNGLQLALVTSGFRMSTDLVGGTIASSVVVANPAYGAQGQWQWVVAIARVTAVGTNPCAVSMGAIVNNGGSMNVYAPLLAYLPRSSYTVAEAAEFTQHAAVWPDSTTTVAAGDVSTLANEILNAFGGFKIGIISPAQLTGSVNDYNPSSLSIWRLSSRAAISITGIAGGTDGRLLSIINVGSKNIVLSNQNSGSQAANQIITGTGTNLTLGANNVATLLYDGTTRKWRVLSSH